MLFDSRGQDADVGPDLQALQRKHKATSASFSRTVKSEVELEDANNTVIMYTLTSGNVDTHRPAVPGLSPARAASSRSSAAVNATSVSHAVNCAITRVTTGTPPVMVRSETARVSTGRAPLPPAAAAASPGECVGEAISREHT